MTDYYEKLGLKKSASSEEIKRAYKELAKKYHPDVSKEHEAEKKFKEVNEAYTILSDPQKKEQYDQYGDDAFKGYSGGGGAGFSSTNFNFEDIFNQFSGFGFSDFGEIFGGRGSGGGTRHGHKDNGSNIKTNLSISFEEAAFGTTKELSYERIERCEKCHGNGAEGQLKKCSVCGGRGAEVRQQRTPFGIFQTQSICHKCHGKGEIPEKECSKCGGDGLNAKQTTISIKIPAGIDTGNHLRLAGKGHEGKDGAGDLFVILFIEPHEIFKRDEEDIYAEIPISYTEAALGATVEVPILRGKADLKIPSGTQTGTIFRMKGKGIKKLNKEETGDEYVKVIISTPTKLSKKQKELLEQIQKEDEASKKRKGIIDRIIGK
ncbi:MAG: molecular chaperone DnaJ [Candidatus Diapherotrites archaeon]|nr:molecular chaperone DnaJ [Candidatus Diapherotrites archaeon]